MYPYFDPLYFIIIAPAFLLALWAQSRVKSAYARAMQVPVPLSGAAAARHVLDRAGLTNVEIEQVAGTLSDHYDPRAKVLRLSSEVYQSRTAAAVGIAAHEAGHAIQDAHSYTLMTIRNFAVPLANYGSSLGMLLIMVGIGMALQPVAWAGILFFSAVVFFQVVNLPVEFDASNRAKEQLVQLGIVNDEQYQYVRGVLNAAAWTYVAATLQVILQLLYFVLRAQSRNR